MDELSSPELLEWEAYDKLDPVGSWREDIRLAYLSSVLVNIAITTHGKKGTKLTKVEDFMLEWDEEAKELRQKGQSVEEMKAVLMSIAKEQNARVRREKKTHRTSPPKSLQNKNKRKRAKK